MNFVFVVQFEGLMRSKLTVVIIEVVDELAWVTAFLIGSL